MAEREIPDYLIRAEEEYNKSNKQADKANEALISAQAEMQVEQEMKDNGDIDSAADTLTEISLKKMEADAKLKKAEKEMEDARRQVEEAAKPSIEIEEGYQADVEKAGEEIEEDDE